MSILFYLFCQISNWLTIRDKLIICFRDPNLQGSLTKLDVETVAQFDDHNSTVWRVCWNVTGTILATSGDDGCVRMFKSMYLKLNKYLIT